MRLDRLHSIEGGDAEKVPTEERLRAGGSEARRRPDDVRSRQAPVRDLVAAVLTVAGVAVVSAGAFTVSLTAGLLVTGGLLVVIGLLLGWTPRQRPATEEDPRAHRHRAAG